MVDEYYYPQVTQRGKNLNQSLDFQKWPQNSSVTILRCPVGALRAMQSVSTAPAVNTCGTVQHTDIVHCSTSPVTVLESAQTST